MFPKNNELIAYEQHKARLQKAERLRLIKTLPPRPEDRPVFRQVTHWLGGRLVAWGLKLQGETVMPPIAVAAIGGANSRHCHGG